MNTQSLKFILRLSRSIEKKKVTKRRKPIRQIVQLKNIKTTKKPFLLCNRK